MKKERIKVLIKAHNLDVGHYIKIWAGGEIVLIQLPREAWDRVREG
jgi:hypothetical protein